jgi:hypothetical protein
VNRRFNKVCFASVMAAAALVSWSWDAFSRYQCVDLKTMGSFPLDPVKGTIRDVPARFRALDGRRVRMVGFMFSGYGKERIAGFDFVPAIPGQHEFPGVQKAVIAKVPDGKAIEWVDRKAMLFGTLRVKLKYDASGEMESLYELDVESVAPVANAEPRWPHWVLRLVGAVFAVWGLRVAFVMLRKHSFRRPAGTCHTCGYDLRATAGRCPECGTVPPARIEISN